MPCGISLSWKSLLFTTASTSRLILSRIGWGVPLGAKSPAQCPIFTPGYPCSLVVGRSLYAVMRVSYVVPIAFSRPALICGRTTMLASEVAGTLLAMTAVTPSLPLLYGMMLRFVTPASLSISATKCGVLAVPAVAQFTPLDWFFAQAMNSFMLLAGMLGFTTMTEG